MQCIPEGCQREADMRTRFRDGPILDGLRSLRDRVVRARMFRGYRKAQPPAIRCKPFGLFHAEAFSIFRTSAHYLKGKGYLNRKKDDPSEQPLLAVL